MSSHMSSYETIAYEEKGAVAWVTLNRPEVYNAFNQQMQAELRDVWRSLRVKDEIHAVVLTGAGDKAFCTGVDRQEAMANLGEDQKHMFNTSNPYMFDDPGHDLGPKQSDLWKPVVAAVNGMACGGAFYLLSECDILIAAEHATFFDPHVTYGMSAVYEPIQMLQKMPFGEIMRIGLLGNYERMSAERAHQIGMLSDVVPAEKLMEEAEWLAEAIASQPALAVQTTLRAIWFGHEATRLQAIAMAPSLVGCGNQKETMEEGQALFASGKRIEPRVR